MFPAVREAYKWVKRVARILKNREELAAKVVRRRLVQLLGRMRQAAATAKEPSVGSGLRHFLKVSKSYWPGLFRCYESSDLPRTNNDLEHAFGSHRYHERRASGRRRASPGLVVMGSARLISGLATRLRPEEGLVLSPGYVEDWRELRAELETRRESRRSSAASAMTRPPISQSWSNAPSSYFCHPSFFLGWQTRLDGGRFPNIFAYFRSQQVLKDGQIRKKLMYFRAFPDVSS